MKVEKLNDFIERFDTKTEAAISLGIGRNNLYRYLKMGDRALVVDGELYIKQGRIKND